MFCTLSDATCLGVVPVFVNAGAALLPAILAGVASVAALIFNPRALVRLCKAKPHIPLLIVMVAVGGYFAVTWVLGQPDQAAQSPAAGRRAPASENDNDWAQVALEILRQEERAKVREFLRAAAKPDGKTPPTDTVTNNGPNASQDPTEPPATPDPPDETPRAAIFRGDASRCGYLGGGSPLELTQLWPFAEPDTMYLSSPIVVGDAVYGASCLLDPPTNYGAIFCLDADTGEERWYTDVVDDPATGEEIEFKGFFSSPAISADGKYLVIGQGLHSESNCQLVCLEADTGKLKWLVQTPLHIEGSPAIEGDVVIAGVGAIEVGDDHKPAGDPAGAGHPGYVLAVRLSDGKELWKHQVNDPESSPVVDRGIAYIGSGINGSKVVALRIETDEELKQKGLERVAWEVDTPYPATGTVTLAGDLVLIGCGKGDYVFAAPDPAGVVLALDRATGEIRWQQHLDDAVLGPIAAAGGKAICPVRNGEVIALDLGAAEGDRVLWRQKISEDTPVLAGPAFTGDYVYAVSQDGYLAVLDAADGSVLQRLYINAEDKPGEMGLSVSSPIVSGGRVYVGSETGGLQCLVGKVLK